MPMFNKLKVLTGVIQKVRSLMGLLYQSKSLNRVYLHQEELFHHRL